MCLVNNIKDYLLGEHIIILNLDRLYNKLLNNI